MRQHKAVDDVVDLQEPWNAHAHVRNFFLAVPSTILRETTWAVTEAYDDTLELPKHRPMSKK